MQILKLFALGWAILIVAIIVNLIAKSIGINTWYDFLTGMTDKGIKDSFKNLKITDILFLFVLYPGIFGVIIHFGSLWLKVS